MIKRVSIILVLFGLFLMPVHVEAKTLRQVYSELDALEAEIKKNEEDKNNTENKIVETKAEIEQISKDLEQLDIDMQESVIKQEKLSIEIENKKEELENLLKYFQITSGENEYLEYIFGAESVTDFIHRNSVVEEITSYNDNLVKDMKDAIEKEKKLRKKLNEQEKEMNQKQINLKALKISLNSKHENLSEAGLTIQEEIDSTREMIELYKDVCKLDEDINVCSNQLPPDTSFWRPLDYGYVTSEWGYRLHPTQNVYKFHGGIDLGVSGRVGSNIYAAAAGKVAYIKYKSSCGGNQVYINHVVKGVTYTTAYLHMKQVFVNVGDIVSKKTVIGTVGGTKSSTPWDNCSTGAHLHFSIMPGMTTSQSGSVNPRSYINLPSGRYNVFKDRTTRY